MISVSLSGTLDPARQLRFAAARPSSLQEWRTILETKVWSPLIWRDGQRGKKQFESCEYIAIDCDNGVFGLKEAVEFCQDNKLAHVIGTTKSHQKEKTLLSGAKSPPVDRFRMVLRASSVCRDAAHYEKNMTWFIRYFAADEACKDTGRLYFPCKEVVSFGAGALIDWKPSSFFIDIESEPWWRKKRDFHIRRKEVQAEYNRLIRPQWLDDILLGRVKVPNGERTNKCFYLGAYMFLLGFTADEIGAWLMKTSLRDIGETELRRNVRNGWNDEQGRGE